MARRTGTSDETRTPADALVSDPLGGADVQRLGDLAEPAVPDEPIAEDQRTPTDVSGLWRSSDAWAESSVPSADAPAQDAGASMERDVGTVPDLSPVTPGPEEGAAFAMPVEPFTPRPAEPARRGGFLPLLLGGVLAAALGFGAAWFARDRLGATDTDLADRLTALETQPATIDEATARRLDDAEARIAAIEAAAQDVPAEAPADVVDPPVASIPAELTQRLEEFDQRLAAIEAEPEPAPATPGSLAGDILAGEPADAPALPDAASLRADILEAIEPRLADAETTLNDFDARLAQAEAASAAATESAAQAAERAAAAESSAEADATRARIREAVATLSRAVDAGDPFAPVVTDLAADGVAVPDALTRLAETGAPALGSLREAFPEAARAGLAAARADGATEGSGLGAWLGGQLAIRSVTPRTGDDPDAILSRVEANLRQGRLDAAVTEAEGLPAPVQEAMAGWLDQARARVAADSALAALETDLVDETASEPSSDTPAPAPPAD